jgi:hypothetical protein
MVTVDAGSVAWLMGATRKKRRNYVHFTSQLKQTKMRLIIESNCAFSSCSARQLAQQDHFTVNGAHPQVCLQRHIAGPLA